VNKADSVWLAAVGNHHSHALSAVSRRRFDKKIESFPKLPKRAV